MSEARLVFGADVYRVSHDSPENPFVIKKYGVIFGHLDQVDSDAWYQGMGLGEGPADFERT